MNMEHFNWVDLIILGIFGISILLGIARGFVREAVSLITWVTAMVISYFYYEPVAALFTNINLPLARYVLAFVLIALAILIIGGIIGHLIGKLVNFTGFGVTDRMIGVLFGFARGIVIVSCLILMVEAINLKGTSHDEVFRTSVLIPRVEPASNWIRERFLVDLIDKVKTEVKTTLE